MEAILPFQTGIFEDCIRGDLVGLPGHEGLDYAVVVDVDTAKREARLAVLQSSDGKVEPHFDYQYSENECFRVARDWVFEIVRPERGEDVRDLSAGHKAGGITISGAAATIRIGRNPDLISRSTPGYLNVATWEPVREFSSGLIGVSSRWRVWLNAQERLRVGGNPLFSFNC